MVQTMVTQSMRAHADILLSRHQWAQGERTEDGRPFYLFSASTGGYYYTDVNGAGCTCRGYLYRGLCAHSVAASERAAEADIEAAFASVALREYGRLFPPTDWD